MLTSAGFGDNPGLTHAYGQQYLAHAVIDLVGAGMVQLIALEIDFRAFGFTSCFTDMLRQTLSKIKWRGPTHIMLQVILKLGVEIIVIFGRVILFFERQNERHQGLGDKAPAEFSEAAFRVWPGFV